MVTSPRWYYGIMLLVALQGHRMAYAQRVDTNDNWTFKIY